MSQKISWKFLAVAIILLIPLFSIGQVPGNGRGFDLTEMILREKENVYKNVETLSSDQKFLMEGIYEEYGESVKETFQEVRKSGNFSEIRTKMSALRTEKDLLINDVLNEEQFTVYREVANIRQFRGTPNNGKN